MLVNKGDKLIVTKDVASFLKKGDVVEVTNVDNGVIEFAFGGNMMHMGVMNQAECESHFTKYVEPEVAPTVTEDIIESIMKNSKFVVDTVFDKCTVVTCKLPNGFIIVESSACVSPENYDEEVGVNICLDKIENKIWELEGYRLQSQLCENYDCLDCDGCFAECGDCDCCEECEELDECLDTDLDCDDCEDYDCPYNSNICNK